MRALGEAPGTIRYEEVLSGTRAVSVHEKVMGKTGILPEGKKRECMKGRGSRLPEALERLCGAVKYLSVGRYWCGQTAHDIRTDKTVIFARSTRRAF